MRRLQRTLRREQRGAVRELRRDGAFMSAVRDREKKAKQDELEASGRKVRPRPPPPDTQPRPAGAHDDGVVLVVDDGDAGERREAPRRQWSPGRAPARAGGGDRG